jgi:hypothetical protein
MTETVRQHFAELHLLHDPEAAQYVNEESVSVVFAQSSGALMSGEGLNHFAVGDALVTGSNGVRWSVARHRFFEKYDAVPPTVSGHDGNYRSRAVPVWAKQMSQAFSLARRAGGDVLHGEAGFRRFAPIRNVDDPKP